MHEQKNPFNSTFDECFTSSQKHADSIRDQSLPLLVASMAGVLTLGDVGPPTRGHLTVSRDIFDCHNWEGCATGIYEYWPEVLLNTLHGQSLTRKNYLGPIFQCLS